MQCKIAHLSKHFGKAWALKDVSSQFSDGRISVILGPSGSGKTTLLRCISGLETADEGEITIGDRSVFNSEKMTNLPPHRREIGMVFQSYGLWPHLSVTRNVGFPLEIRRLPSSQVKKKVDWALEMVGLGNFGERMPGQLSGGEQQRVALARAFASEPGILLMDEPLSNLDALLRESVRIELKELQRRLGITMVYITHDQSEALALADRLIVMRRAAVAQEGDPAEVYKTPVDAFVARFLGAANLVPAEMIHRENGWAKVQAPTMLQPGAARVGKLSEGSGRAVKLMIRPEDLVFVPSAKDATWSGTIRQRVYQGDRLLYVVEIGNGVKLHIKCSNDIDLSVDEQVHIGCSNKGACLVLPEEETEMTEENMVA